MSKILITGAAGFIGSHVAEALIQKGHQVIGIDNFDPFYDKSTKENNLSIVLGSNNYTFIEMDLTSKDSFDMLDSDIEVVIHLAAKAGVRPSIKDPESYLENNIKATQNVLEWMQKNDISKLLFAGSSSVYGNNKKIPFSETDNVDFPISPYAYTKKACELLIYTFHHLYQIDALCLRFFTVYGPRQRPDLAIHKFTKLIYNDQPITMFGDGSTSRDYTFIKDTVSGIIKAVDYIQSNNSVFEIINLGNNTPVKLHELITLIGVAIGKPATVVKAEMQPGDVDCTFADISKAQKILNYQPSTSMAAGLEKFVKWYKTTLE